jgi:hypothetical protein
MLSDRFPVDDSLMMGNVYSVILPIICDTLLIEAHTTLESLQGIRMVKQIDQEQNEKNSDRYQYP